MMKIACEMESYVWENWVFNIMIKLCVKVFVGTSIDNTTLNQKALHVQISHQLFPIISSTKPTTHHLLPLFTATHFLTPQCLSMPLFSFFIFLPF